MSQSSFKRQNRNHVDWRRASNFREMVDLHILPPVPSINGARLRELTGDNRIPDNVQISLRAFRAVAGDRKFRVGFCLGNEAGLSAVGLAVVERMMMDAQGAALYMVPVVDQDIAWDIVLRHLRTFTGKVLLFAFPNSDTYDAGISPTHYSPDVRVFDHKGEQLQRLSAAQRREIQKQKAAMLNRPPPPTFYPSARNVPDDAPWIFRLVTPAGKEVRTAVWNGRRNYAHEMPDDIAQWVGGSSIAIVQVDSPVGVNRRSSLDLTHRLAKEFDGVIHWARDTETFQSIVNSFVRLDLQSVGPPELPEDWSPEIAILAANSGDE